MKKSELKKVIHNILREVKKKGLSGYEQSPNKEDNTQYGRDDKSVTSTDRPKEKAESKKLPVVCREKNTETDHIGSSNKSEKSITPVVPSEKEESKSLPVGGHGGLKEEILSMIRESIEEMARTAVTLDNGIVKGGLNSRFRQKDPKSPTGWSTIGHQKFPDGTPVEAQKNVGKNYVSVKKDAPAATPKSATVSAPEDDDAGAEEPTGGTKAPTFNYVKTQDEVDNYLERVPAATAAEIVDHLKDLNADGKNSGAKYLFVTNTSDIQKMLSSSPVAGETKPQADEPTETDISDTDVEIEKKAKAERLKKFMRLPRAQRDAYLQSFRKSHDKDDDDAETPVPNISQNVHPFEKEPDDEEFDDPSDIEETIKLGGIVENLKKGKKI